MTLRRLQVSDFRCVHAAEVWFDSQFTLISGQNASGKTSLLEAVYVLGRGRSFRTTRLDSLIRSGTSHFTLFGETDLGERRVALGIEGSAEGMRARMMGERVKSLAELAAVLPVQIIDPEIHRLIEEGPSRRRRFLDWGVFHVEQGFIGDWQNYQQVLKQRNSALRTRSPKPAVEAWNGELVRLGTSIDAARRRYLGPLSTVAGELVRAFLGLELELRYRPGWSQDWTFQAALEHSFINDQESGITGVGPQRAELIIRLNGSPVKDRISRGQQKLLAAALLLAQVDLFTPSSTTHPTLLLDDPAAELDGGHLLGLIHEVVNHPLQLIVTSLTPEFHAFGRPGVHYMAEAGRFSEA